MKRPFLLKDSGRKETRLLGGKITLWGRAWKSHQEFSKICTIYVYRMREHWDPRWSEKAVCFVRGVLHTERYGNSDRDEAKLANQGPGRVFWRFFCNEEQEYTFHVQTVCTLRFPVIQNRRMFCTWLVTHWKVWQFGLRSNQIGHTRTGRAVLTVFQGHMWHQEPAKYSY